MSALQFFSWHKYLLQYKKICFVYWLLFPSNAQKSHLGAGSYTCMDTCHNYSSCYCFKNVFYLLQSRLFNSSSWCLHIVFFLYPVLTLYSLFFWLKGSVQWEAMFSSKMAVVSYEYGTLAIEVFFKFCCRLFFNVFPFPPSTAKLLGDFHVIRRCAPNKYIYLIYNAPIL